jgi:ADP-ribosylation factor-like protein 13B
MGGGRGKELTIMLIGLDNSGKTTLQQALGGDPDPFVVPTVGFSAPLTIPMHGYRLTLYDLGGGARIRAVWPSYFADVHGVVYVVDAADPSRLEESASELQQALLHPMVVGKPILM